MVVLTSFRLSVQAVRCGRAAPEAPEEGDMFQNGADPPRLRAHVTAPEGERHRLTSPERLPAPRG